MLKFFRLTFIIRSRSACCAACSVGLSLQSRVPQRLIADNSNRRSDVWCNGFHDAVRSFRSQAGLPVQPVGDGCSRRDYGLRTQLLRLPRASLLHRRASAGTNPSHAESD